METKLQKIAKKYQNLEANSSNYSIGGGLDENGKWASHRHENAKNDIGKVTMGTAVQMFKKATGMDVEKVKEIINYAVPYPEWHHAGFLPKSYGGGMKKTYFLNATEICTIANDWSNLAIQLELKINEKRQKEQNEKNKQQRQQEFLQANAVRVVRSLTVPEFFYETDREMNGKYGWFTCYGKSYNMREYVTGWKFETKEQYNEFFKL